MQLDWTLFLFALTMAMFAVPLLPALLELRRKDVPALAIDRQNNGSAAYAALRALQGQGGAPEAGDQHIEPHSQVDSVACTGDLHIGRGAQVGSAHAQNVYLAPQAAVRQVASAAHTLCVLPGCQFRWLDAPTILFAAMDASGPTDANVSQSSQSQRDAGRDWKQEKFTRIEGNWVPDPRKTIRGDHVVMQDVDLPPGCTVFGSIKAYGDIVVGANSFVLGSLFAKGNVELSSAAQVCGVVSAGQQVRLRSASVVGHAGQLASVTAPIIVTHAGARVHGSVQAGMQGYAQE